MRKTKIPRLFPCLAAALAAFWLGGCSPSLEISIADGGGAEYAFSATVDAAVTETVRAFSGADDGVPLFDAGKIQASLRAAGLAGTSVTLPDYDFSGIDASIEVAGRAELPAESTLAADGRQDILPLIPGILSYGAAALGDGSPGMEVRLTLSPDILASVLAIIPPETAEYAELLSAPVLTGEKMTAAEYSGLISAIYGDTAARALDSGRATVTIRTPREIRAANASVPEAEVKAKGKSAEFSLPLAQLLSRSEEIVFCVRF